jgi:hypothetical protein
MRGIILLALKSIDIYNSEGQSFGLFFGGQGDEGYVSGYAEDITISNISNKSCHN